MQKLAVGGMYRHYKGSMARVICEAKHSETLEDMVIYVHLEDGGIWARPKAMFLEKVMHEGKKVDRFKQIPFKLKIRPRGKK